MFKPCILFSDYGIFVGPSLYRKRFQCGRVPSTAIGVVVNGHPGARQLSLRLLLHKEGLDDEGRTDMPGGSGAAAAARADAISVYWPLDKTWYHGRIDSFDADSGECEVLYDDGVRHTLNLFTQTKYKVKVQHGVRALGLIDVVRADHGHVCEHLGHIGDALRSISDKLPSSGRCSSREGWWNAWFADVDSAVEAGSVMALVKATYELACQVRIRGVDDRDWPDIVSTDWWNEEEVRRLWLERLRSAKTCGDLWSCVDVFKHKAVDWKKARELSPDSDDSCVSE